MTSNQGPAGITRPGELRDNKTADPGGGTRPVGAAMKLTTPQAFLKKDTLS